MITYSPRSGSYGTFAEALREAKAIVAALEDPERFAELSAKFPRALFTEGETYDSALAFFNEKDGQLVIHAHQFPNLEGLNLEEVE